MYQIMERFHTTKNNVTFLQTFPDFLIRSQVIGTNEEQTKAFVLNPGCSSTSVNINLKYREILLGLLYYKIINSLVLRFYSN